MEKAEILESLISELWEIPSEAREEEIIQELNQLSPDPNWSGYIYHSNEFVNEDDTLDVVSLVQKILSFKPIQL